MEYGLSSDENDNNQDLNNNPVNRQLDFSDDEDDHSDGPSQNLNQAFNAVHNGSPVLPNIATAFLPDEFLTPPRPSNSSYGHTPPSSIQPILLNSIPELSLDALSGSIPSAIPSANLSSSANVEQQWMPTEEQNQLYLLMYKDGQVDVNDELKYFFEDHENIKYYETNFVKLIINNINKKQTFNIGRYKLWFNYLPSNSYDYISGNIIQLLILIDSEIDNDETLTSIKKEIIEFTVKQMFIQNNNSLLMPVDDATIIFEKNYPNGGFNGFDSIPIEMAVYYHSNNVLKAIFYTKRENNNSVGASYKVQVDLKTLLTFATDLNTTNYRGDFTSEKITETIQILSDNVELFNDNSITIIPDLLIDPIYVQLYKTDEGRKLTMAIIDTLTKSKFSLINSEELTIFISTSLFDENNIRYMEKIYKELLKLKKQFILSIIDAVSQCLEKDPFLYTKTILNAFPEITFIYYGNDIENVMGTLEYRYIGECTDTYETRIITHPAKYIYSAPLTVKSTHINALMDLKCSPTNHTNRHWFFSKSFIIYNEQIGYDAGGLTKDFYYNLSRELGLCDVKTRKGYNLFVKNLKKDDSWIISSSNFSVEFLYTIGLILAKSFAIDNVNINIKFSAYILFAFASILDLSDYKYVQFLNDLTICFILKLDGYSNDTSKMYELVFGPRTEEQIRQNKYPYIEDELMKEDDFAENCILMHVNAEAILTDDVQLRKFLFCYIYQVLEINNNLTAIVKAFYSIIDLNHLKTLLAELYENSSEKDIKPYRYGLITFLMGFFDKKFSCDINLMDDDTINSRIEKMCTDITIDGTAINIGKEFIQEKFKELFTSFSKEEQRKFLLFVTASPCFPSILTISTGDYMSIGAHTCFNTIDIPEQIFTDLKENKKTIDDIKPLFITVIGLQGFNLAGGYNLSNIRNKSYKGYDSYYKYLKYKRKYINKKKELF